MTVSIRLVVEILDHYHGPLPRKLWLLCWAERASFDTRTGWCPRRVLAVRLGVTEDRCSHIAAELVREGVLKRTDGAWHGHSAVYRLEHLNTAKVGARHHP